MPLTRGRISGYDSERMAFVFTMLNDGEAVECQISAAAMDQLVGGSRGTHADRDAQFLQHRVAIEQIASAIFDDVATVRGPVVRIFAKHVVRK
jgi:Protein of unknown function (DUF1488)